MKVISWIVIYEDDEIVGCMSPVYDMQEWLTTAEEE